MSARCHYCGSAVDPFARSTWQRVHGWQRRALSGTSRRGGSDIAVREAREQWACDECVRRLQRGVAPRQGSLV
jgi:hypothetical protein